MKALSSDLRRRIVDHYQSEDGASYQSTAEHFRVGEATVNRVLRLVRETGDVEPLKKPRPRNFKVDLDWLRRHATASPDARLKDRVADFFTEYAVRVSIGSMWYALKALGWTHKKKRFSPESANQNASKR